MFAGFPFAGPYFGQGPGLIGEPPETLRLRHLLVKASGAVNIATRAASAKGAIVEGSDLVRLKVEP
jgi:hypothetical protein